MMADEIPSWRDVPVTAGFLHDVLREAFGNGGIGNLSAHNNARELAYAVARAASRLTPATPQGER